MTRYDELRDLALAAARDAGVVHLEHVGRIEVADWSVKGTSDFVTHVDHAAEARIVDRIRARFPDHDILAEERADESTVPSAEWLWIIDPLDGTTNFLHRYPMYTASVAVAHRGRIVAGAVVAPATGEAWTAVRGGGAWKDGERIHVSDTTELPHALIGTGFPFKVLDLLPEYMGQFEDVLRRTSGIRRGGSAALDLCHVASGYLDGFWELHLAPWDIAAGILLVEEAGGRITRVDGEPDVLRTGSVLAGNPSVYEQLRDLLRSGTQRTSP